jgi:hypothetical protein|tara:strand:+ start:537 stop:659 length:123 start_codon:yes stop_codon:yes gene_type:complete
MLKKGRLSKLRNQIKRAIKLKDYPKAGILLERYKSNGGKL